MDPAWLASWLEPTDSDDELYHALDVLDIDELGSSDEELDDDLSPWEIPWTSEDKTKLLPIIHSAFEHPIEPMHKTQMRYCRMSLL